MRFCYVDEAGCTGTLPSATSNIQPVFTICGVVFEQSDIHDVTDDFIRLKRRFYPRVAPRGAPALSWILHEIKGSEVRAKLASNSRDVRRHTLGFLDQLVGLLERYACRLIGRVAIKGIGIPISSTSLYTSSIQYIHTWFNKHLDAAGDEGMVICDFRNKHLNAVVSHAIFTQKYQRAGDPLPRILEMPVFGHSDNHAAIQIADLIVSALLFPMAVDAHCAGQITSVHVRPGYGVLRPRYGPRLEALQDHEWDMTHTPHRQVGGVMVSDRLSRKHRYAMFGVPTPTPPVPVPAGS